MILSIQNQSFSYARKSMKTVNFKNILNMQIIPTYHFRVNLNKYRWLSYKRSTTILTLLVINYIPNLSHFDGTNHTYLPVRCGLGRSQSSQQRWSGRRVWPERPAARVHLVKNQCEGIYVCCRWAFAGLRGRRVTPARGAQQLRR